MKVESAGSKKELLILGGSSSIARPIIETALMEGYRVYASFRDSRKTWNNENLTWIYLDTGRIESVEKFLNEIRTIKTDRAIFLIGSLSWIESTRIDRIKFESYLLEQLVNPSYLIIRIFESLKPNSRMLVMSSRAAKRSYDFSYSIVKSGLESLVLSLRTKSDYTSINYVRSGLILDSTMYATMTEDDRIRHTIESNDSLLSLDSAAKEIWDIFNESWKDNEGYFIGQEY